MNHQYDEASDDYRCEADRVHLKNMYFDMNPDKKSAGLTSNKPNILSEASWRRMHNQLNMKWQKKGHVLPIRTTQVPACCSRGLILIDRCLSRRLCSMNRCFVSSPANGSILQIGQNIKWRVPALIRSHSRTTMSLHKLEKGIMNHEIYWLKVHMECLPTMPQRAAVGVLPRPGTERHDVVQEFKTHVRVLAYRALH